MYGGVGTGKTMLMDLFVQAAPPEFKVRWCTVDREAIQAIYVRAGSTARVGAMLLPSRARKLLSSSPAVSLYVRRSRGRTTMTSCLACTAGCESSEALLTRSLLSPQA